jgi:hypothetical protein
MSVLLVVRQPLQDFAAYLPANIASACKIVIMPAYVQACAHIHASSWGHLVSHMQICMRIQYQDYSPCMSCDEPSALPSSFPHLPACRWPGFCISCACSIHRHVGWNSAGCVVARYLHVQCLDPLPVSNKQKTVIGSCRPCSLEQLSKTVGQAVSLAP